MKLLNISAASIIGNRQDNQDCYVFQQTPAGIFAAIFDGHGGASVSTNAAQIILTEWELTVGKPLERLRKLMDHMAVKYKTSLAGSTASIVYIPANYKNVYCAVVGDSPIVLYDTSDRWLNISPRHTVRLHIQDHLTLIQKGAIIYGPYYHKQSALGPGLQLTRAWGDSDFEGLIQTDADVYTVPLTKTMQILLASDGLFDPNHHADNTYNHAILELISANASASKLVEYAANTPTNDNATAIVIRP